jgi:four helix bundle protein
MATIRTYRDLEAWQIAMKLVESCYTATRGFPAEERYGLTAQLRRAAISIPSNIAEGWCRSTTPAYMNHVSIALGSHGELETCVEIGFRLGYLSRESRDELLTAVGSTGRLLNGLRRSLEAKLRSSP